MSSRPLALRETVGFSADSRFSRDIPASEVVIEVEPEEPAEPEPDPLEEAFARGVAEGEAQARKEYDDRLLELEQRFAGMGKELAELAVDESDRLRNRLRETVVALCEETIAPLALDTQLLARRVEKAANMLMRAQDERHIRLHPDDLTAIRTLVSPDLSMEADPSLPRGSLRIETVDGGIEDGMASWQEAIREAVGQC